MKFIPVNDHAVIDAPERHFENRLGSIATRTSNSKNWDANNIYQDTKKLCEIPLVYLDSGGYQLIKNNINPTRFREWIDVYHMMLTFFHKDCYRIFGLDVNNFAFTNQERYNLNDYSIKESKRVMEEHPGVKDKQLFVIQSRTPVLLDTWLELMNNNDISDTYKHYALGGLVGLRQPISQTMLMTVWLL